MDDKHRAISRSEYITGLRKLADMLEADQTIPLVLSTTKHEHSMCTGSKSNPGGKDAIFKWAQEMGYEIKLRVGDDHYHYEILLPVTDRYFYDIVYIEYKEDRP